MRRITLLLIFLLPLMACSVQQQARTLETTLPAAGVTTLMMNLNVIGALTIVPSNDAGVHASVKLMPSNNYFWDLFTSNKSPEAIRGAVVSHALSNGTLEFSVQYPANSDSEDVNEEWTIAVPASVHISSRVNIGKLQVSGIAGGVEASVNVGKVMLDLPGGGMKVSVNVGKIDAQAHSLNYGKVIVGADVGNAELKVNGAVAGDLEKAGAGNHLSYKGHGQDTINLTVNTGKVTLALTGN